MNNSMALCEDAEMNGNMVAVPRFEPVSLSIPEGIEAVSFDIFDTLLVRSFARPIDLFLFLESEYVAERGVMYEGFAREREFAETYARQLAHERCGTWEVTLEEIYAILARRYNVSPQREIELEHASCMPRSTVVDFYRRCREQGRKTFLVSDMYLPRSVIEGMLRKCGVSDWDLFLLSGEERDSKSSGGLYETLKRRAAEDCGVRPDRILHLGDNLDADVKRANEAGLAARHVPAIAASGRCLWEDRKEPLPELPLDARIWLSVCTALAKVYSREKSPDSTERLGFEGTGPLAAAFAMFVRHVAEEQRLKNVFFLARDGLIVKRVFDILFEDAIRSGEFRTHYFFASRRCLYVAALQNPLSEHNLDHLCRIHRPIPLRTLLESVGLQSENQTVFRKVRKYFRSLDASVGGGDRSILRKLLSALSEEIYEATREEREAFYEYVRSFDWRRGLLVDLGWSGTLQDSLRGLLNNLKVDNCLQGVYFGLCDSSPAVRSAAHAFMTCFVDRGSHLWPIVTPLETLFAAPEGTIRGVRRSPDGFEAIRGSLDVGSLAVAEGFQKGAAEFARMLGPILQTGHLPSGKGYAQALVDRLLRHPTREEAMVVGTFPHCANYAHAHVQSVMNIEEVSTMGPLTAWENSCWPDGLLAAISPDQRAVVERHLHQERLCNLRLDSVHSLTPSHLFRRSVKAMLRLAHRVTPPHFRSRLRQALPPAIANRLARASR